MKESSYQNNSPRKEQRRSHIFNLMRSSDLYFALFGITGQAGLSHRNQVSCNSLTLSLLYDCLILVLLGCDSTTDSILDSVMVVMKETSWGQKILRARSFGFLCDIKRRFRNYLTPRRPVHVSVLSWGFFNQYLAQVRA